MKLQRHKCVIFYHPAKKGENAVKYEILLDPIRQTSNGRQILKIQFPIKMNFLPSTARSFFLLPIHRDEKKKSKINICANLVSCENQ